MRSLRLQVVAAVLGLLALGLLALLLLAGAQMSRMTVEAFTHERRVAALAIANNLGGTLEHWQKGETTLQALQDQIGTTARNLNLDVSLISMDGDLIATSRDKIPVISDGLPEVVAALSGTAASEIRDNYLYVAAPVVHDTGVDAVVWIDTSLGALQTELNGRWLGLIGAALGVLILAWVIGWWLANRIVRPLAEIQVVAEQMAGGRLDVRANITDSSTELRALSRAFNGMAQEVEAMLAREREFVANASHELRSPLATIKLRAEALANGAVGGDRARQYAADINDEATRLGNLVTDLLHLSRADRRAFTPPTEALHVEDELAACARTIQPRITAKRQHLNLDIQNGIPELYVHPNDLRMMVGNLLDNAVKYTLDGGHIALSAHWVDSSLVVEVCDDGEGIPAADRARVTERFFRVDRAHKRSVPGTGLGLSLVVATAEQYGGTLTLNSTGIHGEGTRARLTLKPEFSNDPN